MGLPLPQKILTGFKPTGELHLGNYTGAIRPFLRLMESSGVSAFLFIADAHSLTSSPRAEDLRRFILQAASAFLACGLDPKRTVFYRQSDIPELFELNWILSCVTPKGLMNRAHSYKSKRDQNEQTGKDGDHGVNMGLYNYPVLMSADVLLFSPDCVPVGPDQVQHLEMIRDIVKKFHHIYKKELFAAPKAFFNKQAFLPGLDGRKMSKSYGNEIPLFADSNRQLQLIMKIKTDSAPPTAPKDPDKCLIFSLYRHFADEAELKSLKRRYSQGIGYKEAKNILFEKLQTHLAPKRKIYEERIRQPQEIEKILNQGAEKARAIARPFLKEIKKTIGLLF